MRPQQGASALARADAEDGADEEIYGIWIFEPSQLEQLGKHILSYVTSCPTTNGQSAKRAVPAAAACICGAACAVDRHERAVWRPCKVFAGL